MFDASSQQVVACTTRLYRIPRVDQVFRGIPNGVDLELVSTMDVNGYLRLTPLIGHSATACFKASAAAIFSVTEVFNLSLSNSTSDGDGPP